MAIKEPYSITFAVIAVFAAVIGMRAANAAELRLAAHADTNNPAITHVDLLLDTQGDSANAIQATIIFPSSLLRLVQVNDGNSIVDLWITSPTEAPPGEVDLAGIMPGGYSGASGTIASFAFSPLATGVATIQVTTATVLANDGNGTAIPVTLAGATVNTVFSSSSVAAMPSAANSFATPDPFTPEIARDPNLFDDKYFLVFATTDKGSGIDHYEVMEVAAGASGNPPAWHTASSPYLLTDQALGSIIYVRAVDRVGNFIVVEVPTRLTPGRGGEVLSFPIFGAAATLVVLLLLIWLLRRKHRRG